jgi:ssDNA-specific exonuclease RecJ
MRTQEDFAKILGFMGSRDFLKVSDGIVKVDTQNEKQSLGQSFLYNLVLPFVETYWITLAYFAVQ